MGGRAPAAGRAGVCGGLQGEAGICVDGFNEIIVKRYDIKKTKKKKKNKQTNKQKKRKKKKNSEKVKQKENNKKRK
ncbi:hypothetical protein QLF84_23980 [Salmonella enterica subsp. enterica serovar Oslo]|nr:hypothetical protein [Salmonella enterica subsp. enterica serovar Oslo]